MPAKQNLQWWIQHLQQWNGHSFIPETPHQEVYTDASMTGWGIVDGSTVINGLWQQSEKSLHINYLELLVIYFIVTNPRYQGSSIRIYCDNSTAVSYINHFGGTRSQKLLDLTQKIWTVCLKSNTRINVEYVATMFNPADAPSRQQLDQQLEWSLNKTIYLQLEKVWGLHTVDLFATRYNTKCHQFVTWKFDQLAIATNAMSIRWTLFQNPYICPPWNMIPSIVQKLKMDQVKECTLITPNWTSAIWYPRLLKLSRRFQPIMIPRDQVIAAPGQAQSLLEKNHHWQLMAWHLVL